MLYKKK